MNSIKGLRLKMRKEIKLEKSTNTKRLKKNAPLILTLIFHKETSQTVFMQVKWEKANLMESKFKTSP
jgi:hypothetical protein